MIWLALWTAIAVFAFRGFFTGYMRPDSAVEYFFIGLFYIFICCVSFLICGGIAVGIGTAFPSHPVEGDRQHLVAIRDKDGMQGSFFLGSGFVQSQPYYFYYRNVAGGGLKPEQLRADESVTVYQENRTDAELVIFNWKMDYPAWAWIVCLPQDTSSGHSYEFHVPNGTVKPGYSM